jgi:hypothetical protein
LTRDGLIERVAKNLGYTSTKSQWNDSLDFRSISIWSLVEAMKAAYTMGHIEGEKFAREEQRRTIQERLDLNPEI